LPAKRKTHRDPVDFIEGHLPATEKAAQKELETIEHLYEKTEEKKGLIHFDFELDNLIWNGERNNIIDFDDAAMYGYGADTAFALRNLFEGADRSPGSLLPQPAVFGPVFFISGIPVILFLRQSHHLKHEYGFYAGIHSSHQFPDLTGLFDHFFFYLRFLFLADRFPTGCAYVYSITKDFRHSPKE